MNAMIEVVAAEATVAQTLTRVMTIVKGFFAEVVFTTDVVATSILRVLRQGKCSLSAIPADYIRNGGTAVAV
jgi:hypothetical protein